MNVRSLLRIPLLAGLIAVPVAGVAECDPAEIAGTWWFVFSWVEDSGGGGQAGWDDCTVKLNKKGKIGKVNCVSLELGDSGPSESIDLTGIVTGKVQLRTNCRVKGQIVSDGEAETVRGFVDRDVQIIKGVLYEDSDSAITTFTGVRK